MQNREPQQQEEEGALKTLPQPQPPPPSDEKFIQEALKKEDVKEEEKEEERKDVVMTTPKKETRKEPTTPVHFLRPRKPKEHSSQCICCACSMAAVPTPASSEKQTTPRKRKCTTPNSKRKSPAPKRRKTRIHALEYDDDDLVDEKEHNEQVENSKMELNKKIEELKAATTEAEREKTRAAEAKAEAQELRGELTKQDEMIKSLSEKLTSAQSDAAAQEGRQKELEEENTKMLKELAALKELMEKKDRELEALDDRRRKAVNDLEEVSCRIRVVCRVKPLCITSKDMKVSKKDDKKKDNEEEQEQQLIFPFQNNIAWNGVLSVHKYDSVLKPEAQQEDVFKVVAPYIEPIVDGHSCCVMAYGQTGSGKTHTIVGNMSDRKEHGLIMRALEALFAQVERRRLVGWDYSIKGSVLEVYNEVIYDLLDFQKRPTIRHDTDNKPILFDATTVDITSIADVSELLNKVSQNRIVAKTSFNLKSSRSHVLFRFYVYGSKEGATLGSCLDVVDLSGSERFDSEAEKSRITETVKINKSLSTLMHVVAQLALRKPHIPYRDSTLTHLLQASLTGRSKVVLIATVSGAKKNREETLSTLRFADVACSCALNLPPQVPRTSSRPQTPVKPRPQPSSSSSSTTPNRKKPLTPKTPKTPKTTINKQINKASESAKKQENMKKK